MWIKISFGNDSNDIHLKYLDLSFPNPLRPPKLVPPILLFCAKGSSLSRQNRLLAILCRRLDASKATLLRDSSTKSVAICGGKGGRRSSGETAKVKVNPSNVRSQLLESTESFNSEASTSIASYLACSY